MKVMKSVISAVLVMTAMTVIFAFGCQKDDHHNGNSGGVFYGKFQKLGKGTIRSFLNLDPNGVPQAIGLKFSESALSGLSADTSMDMMNMNSIHIDLPSEAKKTVFDHLEVNWNPAGHEPKAIFGLPHFDFHFYLVSQAEQASVIPGPDTIQVPTNYIPRDYQSGVVAIPNMGVHWVDIKSPEFNGQKFTDAFIYGFYHGSLTFIEPMMTISFLSSKPDFKLNIKQPEAFKKSGYYPAAQHISYDSNTKEYTLSLEEMKYYSSPEVEN